ncbi:hypothetical protein GIB67_031609 [Kingdonia uniflora]|uniref:Uncharacterized protein n=1 Tax=Kingdonia uniflora TaxID=39325 RepID=A0A7J7LYL8_9MAGN|nr:hypothetical protein GIB67_031609 [Kingdonia uniflora]
MEAAPYDSSPSFKDKLRSSLCTLCCFKTGNRETLGLNVKQQNQTRLLRSSSAWIRSRAHEFPGVKEKCRNLFCRMGRSRRSADFRYDPLSYALNFDEGVEDDEFDDNDVFHRSFSARLPMSPPIVLSAVAACS